LLLVRLGSTSVAPPRAPGAFFGPSRRRRTNSVCMDRPDFPSPAMASARRPLSPLPVNELRTSSIRVQRAQRFLFLQQAVTAHSSGGCFSAQRPRAWRAGSTRPSPSTSHTTDRVTGPPQHAWRLAAWIRGKTGARTSSSLHQPIRAPNRRSPVFSSRSCDRLPGLIQAANCWGVSLALQATSSPCQKLSSYVRSRRYAGPLGRRRLYVG